MEEKIAGVRLNEGQAIVPKFLSAGVISQVFPLHDLPALGKLQKRWVRAVLEKQPLGNFLKLFLKYKLINVKLIFQTLCR